MLNLDIAIVTPRKIISSLLALNLITSGHLAIAANDDAESATYGLKKTFTATMGTTIRSENPDPAVLGGLSTARVGLPAGLLSATGNAGSSDLNFEKNKPVFLSNPKNPFTYFSALIFVTQEWLKLLSGKRLDQQKKEASNSL